MLLYKTHFDPSSGREWIETDLRGKTLLTVPLLNKGTAFTQAERESLGLLGKLPHHIEVLEEQLLRTYEQYKRYASDLQKYLFLQSIHDANEILFYKLISEHMKEMLPVLYTPNVGNAVKAFSQEYRQPRGLYVSYPDRDKMELMFTNRTHAHIDIMAVTDGEGVLGIGDQGIAGMEIVIAKLILYSLCGVNPYRSLPVVLDVGTDNQALLNDPMYPGWRHPRIRGKEYDDFIAQFIQTAKKCIPGAFIHWEDIGRDNARKILDNHSHETCMFNDDMQGTGVVTIAALLSAIHTTKIPIENQRVVVFGAGTAGVGIADHLKDAMMRSGLDEKEALSKFYLIDKEGLLIKDNTNLSKAQALYARSPEEVATFVGDKTSLLSVVKSIKPTILIGCSTVRGAFTEEVVTSMCEHVERPIIFPLSNPNEKCEALPMNLIQWSKGKALIATGSPFEPVIYNGKKIEFAQSNNALAFPGIGLGVIAAKASKITPNMFWQACRTISSLSPVREDPDKPLLPSIEEANAIALQVARAVVKQAMKDNVAMCDLNQNATDLVNAVSWRPYYRPIKPLSKQ